MPTEQQWQARVEALERQCAALAAQVDRQAKVVDAARSLMKADSSYAVSIANVNIYEALRSYDAAMAQLAKEG